MHYYVVIYELLLLLWLQVRMATLHPIKGLHDDTRLSRRLSRHSTACPDDERNLHSYHYL
jgi:hypothetical protein